MKNKENQAILLNWKKVLVRVKESPDIRHGLRLTPSPGMTATVEIRTGYKTVLEYIFRPLQNVSQALRER
jgi:hypothetical protein